MSFKERLSFNRVALFVTLSLLPLITVGFGLFYMLRGDICNWSVAICLFIIPLLFMTALWFVVFSRLSCGWRCVLAAVLCVLYLLLFLWSFLVVRRETLDVYHGSEAREAYTAAFDPMPQLSEVGEPEQITYYAYYSEAILILTNADYLICRYSAEEYVAQKTEVQEKFRFQDGQISACDYAVTPEACIDGYHFRLLAADEESTYDFDYPKKLMVIATNDETCEIIYLSYTDVDIDYIEFFDRFIIDCCGWQRVRKAHARGK